MRGDLHETLLTEQPPPKTVIAGAKNLPVTLRRFGAPVAAAALALTGPEILFPPEGARLSRDIAEDGSARPVVIKFNGGYAPYRVVVDGKAGDRKFHTRNIEVQLATSGYAQFTVIDAKGQAASVNVFLE